MKKKTKVQPAYPYTVKTLSRNISRICWLPIPVIATSSLFGLGVALVNCFSRASFKMKFRQCRKIVEYKEDSYKSSIFVKRLKIINGPKYRFFKIKFKNMKIWRFLKKFEGLVYVMWFWKKFLKMLRSGFCRFFSQK